MAEHLGLAQSFQLGGGRLHIRRRSGGRGRGGLLLYSYFVIPNRTIPYHIPYRDLPCATLPYPTSRYHTNTIPCSCIHHAGLSSKYPNAPTTLECTTRSDIVLDHTTIHQVLPCVVYHTVPYYTVDSPHNTIPYHTIPYHTIPYHTIHITYHTIPYHTYHSYHTMPHPTLSYPTLPYPTLPYPYPTLTYNTMSYTALTSKYPKAPAPLACTTLSGIRSRSK